MSMETKGACIKLQDKQVVWLIFFVVAILHDDAVFAVIDAILDISLL